MRETVSKGFSLQVPVKAICDTSDYGFEKHDDEVNNDFV